MNGFTPLTDITVLDLTRLAPGPYGTSILADLGADVIKIEEPARGDYLRSPPAGPDNAGMSKFFQSINRNKRSVSLNLKAAEGKEAFYKLVAGADVVTESFRPGVAASLDIEYEQLVTHNPDIIYCSLSGYGQTGPYKIQSGHDLNYMAISGMLHLNGESDAPTVPGALMSDLASGPFLTLSILAALRADGGQYIDISMTDIITTWTLPYMHKLFAGKDAPTRGETRHQKYPSYNIYEDNEKQYFVIGAAEPKFWANLCEALGFEDCITDHRSPDASTRNSIRSKLQDRFLTRNRQHWIDYLSAHDVPISPVNSLEDVLEDPHIKHRGLIVDTDTLGTQFRFPVQFSDGTDEFREPAPALGEHTEEILSHVGYQPDELEKLKRNDVI